MNAPLWIIAGCLVIAVAWKALGVVVRVQANYAALEKRKKVDAIFKKHFEKEDASK